MLDEYWKYIENIYASGGSNLAKAVTYSLYQKMQLNNVLLDEKLNLPTTVQSVLSSLSLSEERTGYSQLPTKVQMPVQDTNHY